MPEDAGIVAEGLEKSYGKVRALAGIDLRAPQGAVLQHAAVSRYRQAANR